LKYGVQRAVTEFDVMYEVAQIHSEHVTVPENPEAVLANILKLLLGRSAVQGSIAR
jgi:hypothetical protein